MAAGMMVPSSLSSPANISSRTSDTASLADATLLTSPTAAPEAERRYRKAQRLPADLRDHCQIHLEEKLYSSALQLLDNALSASNACSDPSKPVLVPPPTQLARLCSLTIHPSFTSRAADRVDLQVSSQALRYLNNLLAVVGPVNSNLRTAFDFRATSWKSRKRRTRSNDSDAEEQSDEDQFDEAGANKAGIWSRAPDFWAALGWAFHCSVAYPERWRYWRAWLEFMLDVIEADWEERFRLDGGEDAEGRERPALLQSILVMYINSPRNERKNTWGELRRAIFAFANGSTDDVAVYKEVFDDETIAHSRNKRKRAQSLDLENGDFGDYFDDDDDHYDHYDEKEGILGVRDGDFSSPTKPETKPKTRETGRVKKKMEGSFDSAANNGLFESIPIRIRLFGLLSKACAYLPDPFTSLQDLYEKFASTVRDLPLGAFRLFLVRSDLLTAQARVLFLRSLIDLLLPHTHKDPQDVDPETDDANGISNDMLQYCFFPYAANKIFAEDNAKLSLVLEHMVRILWHNKRIAYDQDLRAAVEKGIAARNSKIGSRKSAGGASEAAAKVVLDGSSCSLRLLMDLIELETEEAMDGAADQGGS